MKNKELPWEEQFDEKFCNIKICKCCGLRECDHSTTGCPWYEDDLFIDDWGYKVLTKERVKAFIRETIAKEKKALLEQYLTKRELKARTRQIEMLERFEAGESPTKLAKEYGVDRTYVYKIKNKLKEMEKE